MARRIIPHVLLLMLLYASETSHKKHAYNIYRILTPTTMGEKVIMVNFFGQPGIQVLHASGNYTDVKMPKKYNSTFRRLGKNITMLAKEYYYGTKINIGIRRSNCPIADEPRRASYILEDEDINVREVNEDNNDYHESEENENYFTAPFRGFLDYNSIIDYVKSVAGRHPKRIHLRTLGTTAKNRKIYGVIIKSGVMNSTSVLVEGGTIAREWMSITMALYVIREIGTNISAYPTLKNLDWIVVPVVNPDGYEYSYRNPNFRLWEKNRNCFAKKCKLGGCGVNVDRNFPHYYEGVGASLAPCSNFYLGASPLSEEESRSLQSLMMANRHTLKLYVGLRSFGSCILYPWGLKAEQIFDAGELIRVAQTAANAMYSFHRGKLENYTVGNYAAIKYPAAGNIMDFARGVINIKYSYVIYLRGHDDNGEKSYTPESTEIIHIVSECFLGIKSLAEYINARYPPPKANLRQRRNKRKRHENAACSKVINPALFLLMFLHTGNKC